MAKTVLPLRFLKLEKRGYHLVTKVKVNGKTSTLLIDTGASQTVFDLSRIGRFANPDELVEHSHLSTGLGTNTMKSHVAFLEKIEMGKLQILNYDVVVLDLSHVNDSYQRMNLPPIDGVLGSDILRKYKGVVDYKKKILTLETRSKAKKSSR